MTRLNRNYFSTSSLLLAGALVGLTLSACDFGPKMIGKETQGDNDECVDGDMMPSEDGCNTCACNEGTWACTQKGCADPTDGPVTCEDGETKPAGDGCNDCTCYGGEWSCTKLACDPGECQPGDTKFEECNECTCYEGGWACTDMGCVDTDSATGTGSPPDDTEGTATATSGEPNDTEGTGGEGVCGDGIVQPGEQCDDGNAIDDDECSNTCTLTAGNSCGPNDPFEIGSAEIVGDTLNVKLQHAGGCEPHTFGQCWNGAFAESEPVQTWISVTHDAHGDLCLALIEEVVPVDLTQMKLDYQTGYQTQNGTIIIHLEGWGESLEYTF